MNPVIHNSAQNRFEMEVEGQTCLADYRPAPGVWAIFHVETPPELRGRGLATQLAQGIVQLAREENQKIEPICPFMVAYFKRHPHERDVLKSLE